MKKRFALVLVLVALAAAFFFLLPQWLAHLWQPEAIKAHLGRLFGAPIRAERVTLGWFPRPHVHLFGVALARDGWQLRAKRIDAALAWPAAFTGALHFSTLRIDGLRAEQLAEALEKGASAPQAPLLNPAAMASIIVGPLVSRPDGWPADRLELIGAKIALAKGRAAIARFLLDGDPLHESASLSFAGCVARQGESPCRHGIQLKASGLVGPIEGDGRWPMALSWQASGKMAMLVSFAPDGAWRWEGRWERHPNGAWALAATGMPEGANALHLLLHMDARQKGYWQLHRLAIVQDQRTLAEIKGQWDAPMHRFIGMLRTERLTSGQLASLGRLFGVRVRLSSPLALQASFSITPARITLQSARLEMGRERLSASGRMRRQEHWQGEIVLHADQLSLHRWLALVSVPASFLARAEEVQRTRRKQGAGSAPSANASWKIRAMIDRLRWHGMVLGDVRAQLRFGQQGGLCPLFEARWRQGMLRLSGNWQGWPPSSWHLQGALRNASLGEVLRDFDWPQWISGRIDVQGTLAKEGTRAPVIGKGVLHARNGRFHPSSPWPELLGDHLRYRSLQGRWRLEKEQALLEDVELVARDVRAKGNLRVHRKDRRLAGKLWMMARRPLRVMGRSIPAGSSVEVRLAGTLDAPQAKLMAVGRDNEGQ